jgi:dTMP kinase
MSDTERAAAAQADPAPVASLRAILNIRPFRRLWIVLGVASLGDWLGLLATSIFAAAQVSNTTAKGAAFGGVIAVRLLPALLLGPIAGVIADRFDRRYTMIVCDLARFVLLLTIPMTALFTSNAALIIGWTTIATFLNEAITMAWLPAKDASVPNLVPKGRLETANQLTLATTYGITPVAAALLLAGLSTGLSSVYASTGQSFLNPTAFALYFLAFTRLATAGVVFFGIREIGGRSDRRPEQQPSMLKEFITGWSYVGKTPLVRGLVLGILAAFAAGGMVVGSAQLYARSLGGGDSTFYVLFAMIFVGLAIGITAGPKLIGALSRKRWFGLSIVLAGAAVGLLAFAWHLSVAVIFVLLVGTAAGMAFLAGTTLLGREVEDELRGRVFGFVNMSTRVVLMLAISFSSVLVGFGADRSLHLGGFTLTVSTTRVLLLLAGVVGVFAGIAAFRQMDDKPGVPVLADLWSSLRGRPLGVPEPKHERGAFIVFEGGVGAGKSTQVGLLAAALTAQGHSVVTTREPGATEVGQRIRGLLDPTGAGPSTSASASMSAGAPTGAGAVMGVAPRAEALLDAADRAEHVATVVRPALAEGSVVISDRHIDSSLAYAGRALPTEEISWLSAWATGGLKPDLVVLLDIDPAVGLTRVTGRTTADRREGGSQALHERARYAFLDFATNDPRRYLVLDATEPAERIAAKVSDRVDQLLRSGEASDDLVPVTPPPPAVSPEPLLDPYAELVPAESTRPTNGPANGTGNGPASGTGNGPGIRPANGHNGNGRPAVLSQPDDRA